MKLNNVNLDLDVPHTRPKIIDFDEEIVYSICETDFIFQMVSQKGCSSARAATKNAQKFRLVLHYETRLKMSPDCRLQFGKVPMICAR
jgi:hypothetical protein